MSSTSQNTDSPEISLILPTRARTTELGRALDSLVAQALNPARIEVVLYVDDDDIQSRRFQYAGLTLRMIVGPRLTMGEMTRRCYLACRGRCIMLANDDIAFRTPGWDARVLQTLDQFDDGVALIWGNDLHSGLPAHPFLSRVVGDALGAICPPEYRREFIDTHIYDVFRKLQDLGHDRMRYLPDVEIEHLHLLAGKAPTDAVYESRDYPHDERVYLAWEEERLLLAQDLARWIETAPLRSRP